jgi:hypothetical protein
LNRLVIVGNGFDLAHGLQTGYEHFLIDYFKKSILEASQNEGHFSDEFIQVSISQLLLNEEKIPEILVSIESLDKLQKHQFIDFNSESKSSEQLISELLNEEIIQIRIENIYFKLLLSNKNWTDIEFFYYKYLIKSNPRENLKELNLFFETLQTKLIAYIQQINEIIPKHEVLQPLKSSSKRMFEGFNDESDKMLFVNFNYTELLSKYVLFDHQPNHNLIYIHGKITDEETIIFGYGDDSDENYKQLENAVNDDFLVNIKSFKYPLENNYSKLIEFVDSGEFEVFCVGHSLGVSDRVLLKTIFEDKNCKKIRLFHRGDKRSYFRKCIAISRHFTDKIAMRKKLVDYDELDVLKSDI